MNKLSTSIVNHKYLFYFHICMENSDPSIRSILKQIAHRYLGQHYPTLAQLTPLHLAHDLLSPLPAQTQGNTAPQQAPEKVPSPSETNSSQVITSLPEPQLPPVRDQRKASSWEYLPPHADFSKVEIFRLSYRALQPHVLSSPIKIPCRIFVDEEDNEEILFFNRLAKILTQQLFPTTLISVGNKNVFHNHESFSLSLAPLAMIRYKISHARYHQSFSKNGSTWIPIYSSIYYENDPQLKRDLWTLLNQLPFAYTQKSS